jgi:membrane protein DedA with SNARE-associated domain
MRRRLVAGALLLGVALLAWPALPAWVGGASAERVAAFVARADPATAAGFAWFAALVFAASMLSEDLTCIGVGLLVARGRVGLAAGVAACAFALWLGDLVLYGAGRLFDLPRLRARAAFGAGPLWILASRFVPGARLPTYVAAGALRYPPGPFAFWLAVGALAWAPLLVGGAAGIGSFARARDGAPIWIATAIALLAAARLAPRLATWRGRRLLVGAWLRVRHWEFWPIPVLYAPVAVWVVWQALRHRSLRAVTAVNPAIPGGGLVGEPKAPILAALAASAPDLVARTALVPGGASTPARVARVRDFQRAHGLDFPLVLKPDVGERGAGVVIARSDAEVERCVAAQPDDLLVQEHVPGVEAGLFWIHDPRERQGRLWSITEKRMLAVTGDGASTLEALILRDRRAVCLAPVHLARHAASLARVPAHGEVVQLVEIGTHSRGALFLDGARLATPALEAAVARLCRGYPGFHFGRFDVRADSIEALRAGRFRAVELNGLTAEAAHMYDPKYGVGYAWRTLFAQWRIAFEIGAANTAAGARPASWRELRALWRQARGRPSRAKSARLATPCWRSSSVK